jgi:hypothetical protein
VYAWFVFYEGQSIYEIETEKQKEDEDLMIKHRRHFEKM